MGLFVGMMIAVLPNSQPHPVGLEIFTPRSYLLDPIGVSKRRFYS